MKNVKRSGTYDEEDLGGSMTIGSVKDFGPILVVVVVVLVVIELCVFAVLLGFSNLAERHRCFFFFNRHTAEMEKTKKMWVFIKV